MTFSEKLIIFGGGSLIWAGFYFLVNNLNHTKPQKSPVLTRFDHKIHFSPQWIYIYLSTYFFVHIPLLLIADQTIFMHTLLGYILISAISGLVFVFYPSTVQRVEIDSPTRLCETLIYRYQQFCKPKNNFPSLHVGMSILPVGVAFAYDSPILGAVLAIWAVLIALSTLMTKQHYITDILFGSVLGCFALVLVLVASH